MEDRVSRDGYFWSRIGRRGPCHSGFLGRRDDRHRRHGSLSSRVTRTALGVTDVGVAVTVAGYTAGERAPVGRLVTVARLAGLAELAHVAETRD